MRVWGGSCTVRDIRVRREGYRTNCRKTIRDGGVFAAQKRDAAKERRQHRFDFYRAGFMWAPWWFWSPRFDTGRQRLAWRSFAPWWE